MSNIYQFEPPKKSIFSKVFKHFQGCVVRLGTALVMLLSHEKGFFVPHELAKEIGKNRRFADAPCVRKMPIFQYKKLFVQKSSNFFRDVLGV